jgi:hypothetical protein
MQVKEKFLIDNYYEIGRMHLHTNTPDFDSIGFEKLNKLGMVLNKEHYSEL